MLHLSFFVIIIFIISSSLPKAKVSFSEEENNIYSIVSVVAVGTCITVLHFLLF